MTLRIRTGKKALELRLHELEAAIMDIVWSKDLRAFSVGEVLEALSKKRDIAYTTVMTTLVRLHDKGLLARRRDGKRYLYTPKASREQFLESTAREVLDRTVAAPIAMSMLVDRVSTASAADLDALELLIQKRREELE